MYKYCKECGRELIKVPKRADKIFFEEMYLGDIVKFPLGSQYNGFTGLRQFGIITKCPKAKWYNNHTEFPDKNSLHDSDLPELTN